jgi:serine protease Do
VAVAIFFGSWQPTHAESLDALEQQAIREASELVSPAVVQLQVIGGADRVDDVNLSSGPATGVILSPDGYVVTSRYRFDPPPATVIAILANGQQFASQIVASDFSRKLVLLKLTGAHDLPVAKPTPTDSVRVGQWAIAIGRTYRGDRPNVSVGIVSATNRIFGRALQTDADISPANYGGPLVDIEGRVLGILSPMSPTSESTIAGVDWYDSGIGFAVPLESWLPAFERLKQGEDLQPGYLGVGLSDGTPRETPPGVKSVVPQGPAAEAGLEAGDLITSINGKPLETQTDLKFAVTPHYAGDTIEVTYERGDNSNTVDITLATIAKLQEAANAAAAEKEAEREEN